MPVEPRKSSSFVSRFNSGLNRLLVKLKVDEVPHIKRIIVTVVGGTILVFGVILIVTPGPAVLVIPVGLAILGTEYAWARRWMRKARQMAQTAIQKTQEIIRPAEPVAEKPAETDQPDKTPSTAAAAKKSSGELVGTAADGKPDRSH